MMGPQFQCQECGHFMYQAEYYRRERCNGCGNTDDDKMEEVDESDKE